MTEEPETNTFAQALAGRIQKACFHHLDAPVDVIGSADVPAIPLNSILEKEVIPNAEKVSERLGSILAY